MASLKKLAISATVWTVFGYGTSQFFRFGNNLILTRLLVPEMFGLMALVNTLRIGLELFSDLGIGASVIQNQRGDDPVFFNTAWTLQVIRGICLWLLCLIISYPIAVFYQESRLLWLFPIVGLQLIFNGFKSTAIFTFKRRIALAQVTLFELGVQIVSLVVMIVWAWFSPNIWSLVVGGLVGSLLGMILSHYLIPNISNRFAWDRESLHALISFGKWIFISTMMMFLAAQTDRLILGKLLSLTMLGVYTIAYTLADLPRQVIHKVSSQVIFPLVAQNAKLTRNQLRSQIINKRGFLLILAAIFLSFLISFGDLIISILYDERYTQATWMMPILGLGIWPCLLYSTMSAVLLGVGKPLYSATANFIKFSFLIIGIPLGFFVLGNLGAIIAIAVSDIPVYIVILYGCWREKILCLQQDILFSALFIMLLIVVLGVRFILGWGIPIDRL